MSKWMVVPVVAAAAIAAVAAPGSNTPDHDDDGLPDQSERPHDISSSPGFPNRASTGVPPGWSPKRTLSDDLRVTKPGAVVEDVLLRDADLIVDAPNVTIRRVKLQGGQINTGSPCNEGTLIVATTLEPPPGQSTVVESEGAISYGGYTARRVEIWRRAEGFRVGGKSDGCGPVQIEDSFVKVVDPPGANGLHPDGLQGYGGSAASVSNTTIDFRKSDGTAPFFVPSGQGNTSATVNRLLVMGGGYSFRLGVRGAVSGLKVVDDSWDYGPIDVACSALRSWEASIVTITSKYQIARTVRRQPCNTEGGA